jgi:hypothetical protein
MWSLHASLVYQQLWELNEGFAQVHRVLKKMQSIPGFNSGELARYGTLTAEARTATLSYLLEILGGWESDEAGRLFSSRQRRKTRPDGA